MNYKRILFFSLLFLTNAVHPMKHRRALSKGFFARNAQSLMFLHQKNTHGPLTSQVYSSTPKSNLSRIHFSRNLEHTHFLPIIIGIGIGYGISSAKTGKVYTHDENETNEISITELFDRVRDNTLEFCLIESPDKAKYQKAILDNYSQILFNYSPEQLQFFKIFISYLKKIKNQKNSFLEAFAKSLGNKFQYHETHLNFINLVETFIENHPFYTKTIFLNYVEHRNNYRDVYECLEFTIQNYPSLIKDQLIKNFLSPEITIDWNRYISACISVDPASAQEFARALANIIEKNERIENIKLKVEDFLKIFKSIALTAPYNKELANALQKKLLTSSSHFDIALFQGLFYSNFYIDYFPKTPTTQHLKENFQKDYFEVRKEFIREEDLSQLAHNIIMKEKELQKTHYTFIHAQRKNYLLAEQLHTFFELLKRKKSFKNAQFLNLRVEKHSDDIEEAKEHHNKLIQNGCPNYCADLKERGTVLFMNKSLFGNISRALGKECSAEFISSNYNISSIKLDLKNLFILHGHNNLYAKYQAKLETLYNELVKDIPNYGTCILIAIPKEDINKYVFSAQPGGPKRKVTIEDQEKFYETDNVSHILQTLENDPSKIENSDHLIFCLPMTTYSGLNPESGIKMYPFTAGNSSQLDAWYTQLYNLFDEIEADINKKENKIKD